MCVWKTVLDYSLTLFWRDVKFVPLPCANLHEFCQIQRIILYSI